MGMMAHRCKRNGELGGTAPPLRSALTSGFEGESPQILLSRPRGRVVLGVLVSLGLTADIVGCRPQEASGKGPLKAGVQAAAAPPRRPGPESVRAPEPPTKSARRDFPAYELPFEARANPFEPPDAGVHEPQSNTTAAQNADVRLLGLMNSGTGRMATVEVYGRHHVVLPGTKLVSPDSIAELYVREIRATEIVVEQRGRRWIVPLPRTTAIHPPRPMPTAKRSRNAKGSPVINGR